ncbi:MAG: GldG family protein [Betaproteobacteria bacterium]|nr:GldG family protein [Betaproteobacteria bacterium]
MIVSRRTRIAHLIQNGVFAALLVAAVLLVAPLAQRHFKDWALTQNSRNSLSEGSVQTLALLKGPVRITGYATEQNPTLGNLRLRIADFIGRYQRVKKDIEVAFIDPREQPKAVSAANIRVDGEMIVEYDGRSEHLTSLDEQSLTNLLARLARKTERTIMFLDGHGERKPSGIANHDLGEFGKRLETKGFKVSPLNLAAAQQVPDNAAVLVIANPQVDLLPVEVEKIKAWIEKGGSIFWMIDQEPLHGLQPIADLLRLQLGPGVVVDPAANALKASATLSIAFAYGNHPATRDFALNSAFPSARRIAVADDDRTWRVTPLVEVAQSGWVEMGELSGDVGFDKARDIKGPITVVAALEREVEGKSQRIVVTGSGHFLANTYAGLLGNLDLGINFINWLSGDENLITLQPKAIIDGSLTLSRSELLFLMLTFLLAIPGAFLFTGGMIWWRRRHS